MSDQPIDLDRLDDFFPAGDISWRLLSHKKSGDKIIARPCPFISARAVQSRLDQVVGKANWRPEIRSEPGGVVCRLWLRVDGEWLWKEDGAAFTDVESFKGGISDAEKRAAVQWGIGRYLHALKFPSLPADLIRTERPMEKGWQYASKWNQQTLRIDYEFWWKPPVIPAEFLPPGEAATLPAASQPAARQPVQQPASGGHRGKVGPRGPQGESLHALLAENAGSKEAADELIRKWSQGKYRRAAEVIGDEDRCAYVLDMHAALRPARR
jgi:hypothetical protein